MDNQTPDPQESLWRRKLTPVEYAELRDKPELELEARLTDSLSKMPNAVVPSNFTTRVIQAIDLEEARAARSAESRRHWNWRQLLPRFAVTAAVLFIAGVGLFQHQHETGVQRAEMIKSLSVVASVAKTAPDVDALNNFDAIQRMSQSGRADTELLAALQ